MLQVQLSNSDPIANCCISPVFHLALLGTHHFIDYLFLQVHHDPATFQPHPFQSHFRLLMYAVCLV